MAILGLNHAVLYVRDAKRSSRFYEDVLGFIPVIEDAGGRYAFLRAPASVNHHDIAFFSIGQSAGASAAGKSTVGMYHIAWAVPTVDELIAMREKLIAAGAFGGESDHGVNKSFMRRDPDGLEFEVTYVVPPQFWGAEEHEAIIRQLDLETERARFEGVVSHVVRAAVSQRVSLLGLEPLERRSLPDEIRDRLLSLIRNGDLTPGQQLPAERLLCAELTVARTSVREAIQALVSLGYVERRGNRAYVVEHLPEVATVIDARKAMVHDLFETRRVIEVQMAELATCRATAAQRAELATIAEQFTPTMKLDEFRQLDRRFHWLIASACGNQLLTELYGKVLDALFGSTEFHELLYAGHNRREVTTIVERSGLQHRTIARAIVDGEPIAVVSAVDEHLNDVGQRILERLR